VWLVLAGLMPMALLGGFLQLSARPVGLLVGLQLLAG